MPDSNSSLHIYLSYSRADADLAARIVQALASQSITIQTENDTASDAPRTLQTAVQTAGALVVLLTPNARQSRWVREAWQYALKGGVRVFPFLLRGDLGSALPADFTTNSSDVIDVTRDFEFGVQKIVTVLCDHFDLPRGFTGYLQPHNPLHLLRLLSWLFLAPSRYHQYEAYAGEQQTRRVLAWLLAALTWLPLLLTMIGYSVSRVPGSSSRIGNLVFMAIILLAWLLTGIAGRRRGAAGGLWVVLGSATFFVVLPLSFALVGGVSTQYTGAALPFSYLTGGALVLVSVMACGLAIAAAGDTSASALIAGGMTLALTTSVALVLSGGLVMGVGLAFAFAGGIALGYGLPLVVARLLKSALQAMQATRSSKLAFGSLLLAYLLLLWVFVLGGWTGLVG